MTWKVDLVIFGTGKIAQRVLECAAIAIIDPRRGVNGLEDGMTVGVAGRSLSKLEMMRSENASCRVAILPEHMWVVDIDDHKSLVEMAAKARCVVNCMKACGKQGEKLVKACFEAGANMIDTCTDADWMRSMKNKYHQDAIEQGLLMISSCGWNSVPADAMFWLMFSRLKPAQRLGHITMRTLVTVYQSRRRTYCGPITGGTPGSLSGFSGYLGSAQRRQSEASPLIKSKAVLDTWPGGVTRFKNSGKFGIQSELFADPHVVRESYALLEPNGSFEYQHFFVAPYALVVYFWSFLLWAAPFIIRIQSLCELIMGVLRATWKPPMKCAGTRVNYQSSLVACSVNSDEKIEIEARCEFDRSPIDVAALVLLRSALVVAKNQDQLPINAGFITPSAAFGDRIFQVLHPCWSAQITSVKQV